MGEVMQDVVAVQHNAALHPFNDRVALSSCIRPVYQP